MKKKKKKIVESFPDCGKVPWSKKISLTVKEFLNSLILENFLYCGKLTFLTAEKVIGLTILSLEQKLSSLAFFAIDKFSIILYIVEDLSTNR